MRRQILAVLALALLAGPARAQITYMPPAFGLSGSVSVGCVPKATSATGIACGLLTDDGTNVTLSSGALIFGTTSGLFNPSANVLALRNGTNAQTFRAYNTYTDASNGEWATFDWSTVSNRLTIGPVANGSGTLRSIGLTSHLLWNTDNTYDIGASGANRPRIIYVGTQASISTSVIGQDVQIGDGRSFYWATRGGVTGTADGIYTWADNAGTSFGRFNLGGTTSSFPAIKRSSAGLVARLADDSADTTVTLSNPIITGTSSPASGAACTTGTITWDASYIYVCTASGAWKRSALTGGY